MRGTEILEYVNKLCNEADFVISSAVVPFMTEGDKFDFYRKRRIEKEYWEHIDELRKKNFEQDLMNKITKQTFE